MRLVRDPAAGEVRIDAGGRAPGRGGYLHRELECVELARRRGALGRALKATAPDKLWEELLELADRR